MKITTINTGMVELHKLRKIALGVMIAILLTVISIFLVSAVSLQAGECKSFDFLNDKPIQLKVENNSSDLEGMNWTKIGRNITYCFDIGYATDNFTLTWWNEEEMSVPSSSGGGSGSYVWGKKKVIPIPDIVDDYKPIIEDEVIDDKVEDEPVEEIEEVGNYLLALIIMGSIALVAIGYFVMWFWKGWKSERR